MIADQSFIRGEMDRDLRDTRVRQLLDEMSRPMLYALARAVEADVRANTYRRDLVDDIAAVPLDVLRRGLAGGVNPTDLKRLCARLGYAFDGPATKLAGRLIAAVEQPNARIARWRPFDQARMFARRLQLRAQTQWYAFARGRFPEKGKLPGDIPIAPYAAYADRGWTNWGDFLGTENPARHLVEYRAFARARSYVRALEVANVSKWRELCRRKVGNRRVLPPDIPAAPDRVYADKGWVSWGDWFGNGRTHASKIGHRSYAQARAFVRALGIQTEPEWRAYCRGEIHRSTTRPLDVPSNPQRTYKKKGWVSWGEFLGTGSVALYNREFRSYAAARAYVRSQRLRNSKDWRKWCASGQRPAHIPGAPDQVYADNGWVSWGEFFGTGSVHPARRERRPMREAQAFVRKLGVRTKTEFMRAWHEGRIPKDIPLTIDRMPGWKSWSSFLGT
jgi:hypothetical protein